MTFPAKLPDVDHSRDDLRVVPFVRGFVVGGFNSNIAPLLLALGQAPLVGVDAVSEFEVARIGRAVVFGR